MSKTPPVSGAETSRVTPSGLRVADDALALIANTPLVRLKRVAPAGGAAVWAKAELMNPAGSVKDRPALSMIVEAERAGRLAEGATIDEATSGNTGISLAMIAAVRGYRCVLVMPEDMSLERRYILRAYGADIVLTPATDGMTGAVSRAKQVLEETPGAFMPSQFANPANPLAHQRGTALEILEQTGGEVAAFVSGVGTGGTITGVGRVLREKLGKSVSIVAVEPAGSAVLSGKAAGMHGIQGLGAGFIPQILERDLLDRVAEVSDVAAERMARRLAREEGLLVGPSSGANVHVACELASELGKGNVVTILCDSGERYLF
jgi:cysteine synthase A